MSDQPDKPFLQIVVCAAGVAADVGRLITAALCGAPCCRKWSRGLRRPSRRRNERQWDVGVVATPHGLGFLDAEAVEIQTGRPIRSAWRSPGEPRPSRSADAIAVAPATFNTVNKWAAGISDNLALGILCEAPAMGVPVAVLPYLNSAQAAHPAYRRSLGLLREMGVLIGSYEPHRPKAGGEADRYRWEEVLELLASRLPARS